METKGLLEAFLDQEEFTDSITGSNSDETRSMYNSPILEL